MTNEIKSFKKAIWYEKIAKFNPYHDRLGRFSSADGASFMTIRTKDPSKQHMADAAVSRAKENAGSDRFKNLNANKKLSEKDREELKKIAKGYAKELASVDSRLGITEEAVIKTMGEKCFGKSNRSMTETRMRQEKQFILSRAVDGYITEKLGVRNKGIEERLNLKELLNFVDGASWAREKLGNSQSLKFIDKYICTGDPEEYDFIACTARADDGIAIYLSDKYYSEWSDYFSTHEDSGMSPKNFSSGQVGAHEYAHAVEYDIASRVYGELKREAFDGKAVSGYIIDEASKRIGKTTYDASSEVSEYALTNASETFAECISDVYSNGENAADLSKEVFHMATEEMDDICAELERRK